MLQEIETGINTDTINLSATAAEAVRRILAERNLEGYSLRVYVSGSGCCGAQFGMALDNNVRGNDMTFQSEGVQVIVDDMSINYLRGAKVDFVNDPQRGAGFVVDSPIEMGGSCACGSKGESHSHAEAEEDESCACGGSCGCGAH
jgi:iron-sulfur cluster insertion protein